MDKTGFYATKELIQNWTESRKLLRQAIQILGFQEATKDVYRLGRGPKSVYLDFWLNGVVIDTFDREVQDVFPGLADYMSGRKECRHPDRDVRISTGSDWCCWEHPEMLVFARRNWHG